MSDVLTVGSQFLTLDVSPGTSGRVIALRHEGENLLSMQDAHPDNWGATYWTSPQSDWGWPPVPEVDGLPYEVLKAVDGISVRSRKAKVGAKQFVIEKHFRLGPHGAIDTEYVIENCGDAAFKMASWEISRVPRAGLTFFPTGTAQLTPVPPHADLPVEKSFDTTFYDHSTYETGKHRKLHADGQGGYLAHLIGRRLVLKIFADSPAVAQAPGEGECEIFAIDDGSYVEVEVQGPYEQIEAGARASFVIRTVVVVLPEDVGRSDRERLRQFADEQVARYALA